MTGMIIFIGSIAFIAIAAAVLFSWENKTLRDELDTVLTQLRAARYSGALQEADLQKAELEISKLKQQLTESGKANKTVKRNTKKAKQ